MAGPVELDLARPALPGVVPPAVDDRLSVVMITRNRRAEMDDSLRRLARLPERPPVLVVDNGSEDGSAEWVRDRFPDVKLLTPGRNLGAAGRNLGVAASESPYVAFCDDDTSWSPGSLRRATEVLDSHPRVAVVTAHIVVHRTAAAEDEATEDPICEDLRTSPVPRLPDSPGPCLVSFLAGASVVRRSAFLAAGGFEARLQMGGEEELLASDLLRQGWQLVYLADMEISHRASVNRDAHLRRRQGIRNTLWFNWLRRPAPQALRLTVDLLGSLPRDRVSVGAVQEACRGWLWVARRRQVVPPEVEAMYRAADEVRYRSGARRYVS